MALYQRGNVWHYDFSVRGKRYRGSTEERTKSRAEQVQARLIQDYSYRTDPLPKKAPTLRQFADRFKEWVDASQLEPDTQRYYKNGWKMLEATRLPNMTLDRITTDEVEAVHITGKPARVNQAIRTLRRMLGKAADWGVIRTAPRLKLAKEYGREQLIDKAAEAKLLSVATQPLRDVILIIQDTGMRPREVFRLTWEDVDFASRTIFIQRGKTRAARRSVPMSERILQALKARCKGQTTGWVFPSDSKCGHLTTVAKQFRRARKLAGLPTSVVLYCARHTFGTYTLESTGNLAAVMRVMGHEDVRTAMRYQHPGLSQIRSVIDARNATLPALDSDNVTSNVTVQ